MHNLFRYKRTNCIYKIKIPNLLLHYSRSEDNPPVESQEIVILVPISRESASNNFTLFCKGFTVNISPTNGHAIGACKARTRHKRPTKQ